MLPRLAVASFVVVVFVACESKNTEVGAPAANVDGGGDVSADSSAPDTNDAAISDASTNDSAADGSTTDGSTTDGSTTDGSTTDAGFDAGYCSHNLDPSDVNDWDGDGWSVVAGDCNDCDAAIRPALNCP